MHELFNAATVAAVAGVGTSGTTSTTATIGATANVMAGDFLTSLVTGMPQSSGSCSSGVASNSIQGLESATSSKVASSSTEHTATTSGLIQLSVGSPTSSNEANCDFDQLGVGES